MSDSLRQYRLEIGTMLDSIIATDSSFKEVEIIEKEDQLVICMPEHFFFTGNNRNFISAKGKSMNQLLATLLHKHPSALARLTIYLPEAASNSAMKEPSDKASMRIASIYRSLHYENDIATERMQAGISANDPLSDKVCFTLFTGMKPIFETIKKL